MDINAAHRLHRRAYFLDGGSVFTFGKRHAYRGSPDVLRYVGMKCPRSRKFRSHVYVPIRGRNGNMRFLASTVIACMLLVGPGSSQEYQPYPEARVTISQWQ